MKIIQKCSVCNTTCISKNNWNDLKDFYAAELSDPEFEHGDRDCGGGMEYTLESTIEEDAAAVKWGFDSVETMVKWGACTHDELMEAVGSCDCSTEECQKIIDFWNSSDNTY